MRSLYSDFNDKGHRWEYVLTTVGNGTPSSTTERRLAHYLVSTLLLGGNHVFTKSWFNWGVAASHSRLKNPIANGESITTFVPLQTSVGAQPAVTNNNCNYDAAATKDPKVRSLPQIASSTRIPPL